MAAKLESTESAAATRPLLPEPSGARKAAKLKGQVKARLLHEWLSHSPKTIIALTFPQEREQNQTEAKKLEQHLQSLSLDFSHEMASLRWALYRRHDSSSYKQNTPLCKAVRSKVVSMILVKESASINVVGIHRKVQCSWHCSLISNTSKVVRYSSQDGMAVLLTRSYRLRQSVVITALGSIWKAFLGFFPCKLGHGKYTPEQTHPSQTINASGH